MLPPTRPDARPGRGGPADHLVGIGVHRPAPTELVLDSVGELGREVGELVAIAPARPLADAPVAAGAVGRGDQHHHGPHQREQRVHRVAREPHHAGGHRQWQQEADQAGPSGTGAARRRRHRHLVGRGRRQVDRRTVEGHRSRRRGGQLIGHGPRRVGHVEPPHHDHRGPAADRRARLDHRRVGADTAPADGRAVARPGIGDGDDVRSPAPDHDRAVVDRHAGCGQPERGVRAAPDRHRDRGVADRDRHAPAGVDTGDHLHAPGASPRRRSRTRRSGAHVVTRAEAGQRDGFVAGHGPSRRHRCRSRRDRDGRAG